MKSLFLNKDGDIEFDSINNLKMVDGVDEIVQRNRILLNTNQGEWIFDIIMGIPWVELMGDKNTTPQDIQDKIKQELKQDEKIDGVKKNETDYDRARRNLKIKFVAILEDGQEVEEEVVI